MNTVLFVNATIGFSGNLFLVIDGIDTSIRNLKHCDTKISG